MTESKSLSISQIAWYALMVSPFAAMHLACLMAFWVGVSWIAVATCIVLYYVRMFGITGGYHRYFSHRSFKTSRAFQFVLAVLGNASVQMGPLWWAAMHRHHHKHSDTEDDHHSPVIYGFLWAHVGWFLSTVNQHTDEKLVKDLTKFPELVFLNRHYKVVPILLALSLYLIGHALYLWVPALGTNGLQMLTWGFFISTVLLYHGTFTINSVGHVFGTKRYKTGDESRNNWMLAFITLGEGWHNNHHRYPWSERQGFFWWELDITHYALRVFEMLGLVWDLKTPPKEVLEEAAA